MTAALPSLGVHVCTQVLCIAAQFITPSLSHFDLHQLLM